MGRLTQPGHPGDNGYMDVRPRLLYVEDELAAAQIAVEVLEENYAVTHAETGEQALKLALSQPFDVMVLDRRLPGMSGTELLERVRRAGLATPVILLTALGTVDDRVAGLDGGANDYLVKPFDFAELQARLRALLRGFRAEQERVEIGGWTFTPQTNTVSSIYGERATLTEAESSLLSLLAANPDRIFSREEILAACFPRGEGTGTVDSYVHYIRRKTEPGLVETVRARGYRIGAPK